MARSRLPLVIGALALGLAGCSEERHGLPASCSVAPAEFAQALDAAPRAVALPGGTRISECVRQARSDAELQSVGSTLTSVADGLTAQARREPTVAVRLGYLIGAARRGAGRSEGIALELARRVERSAVTLDGAPRAIGAALQRGLRAGEAGG